MKRFVTEVLLFALLSLSVFVAGELYIRHQPNPARDKHEWMLRHSDEVETLVLGSSHTFYGVIPEMLGSQAFSLAMVSQTYRYDKWLLERYDLPRLRTVILPFSYFSLYEDYETGVGENYISRYRIYMDCPLHSAFSKYNLEMTDFYGFREKLKRLWQPQQMTWSERGWGSNYLVSRRTEPWDNGAERAQVNTYADTSAVALNTAFLTDIFEWGRRHGVCVLLISTPLSETYCRAMDPRQTECNRRVLGTLLREYPEVEYVDFSADGNFEDSDFYDADHLSDQGARKLSALLVALLTDRGR